MNTARQLLLVSRPVSWLNTAYPFAAGYLVTLQTIDWRFILGTLFFLIPYNLLMYGVNDVFDYESDIRNPRKGGMEGAKTARTLHRNILISATISTLLLLIPLIILCDVESIAILAGILFFVLAYSVPKLRFKERPVLDSITSSLHFVGPLVFALALADFPGDAWWLVASFFFWGMASHAFGAVQDIIPDRAGGLHSIATFFGAKITVRLTVTLYVLSGLLLIPYGLPTIGLLGVVALYIINVLPYWSLSDKDSAHSNPAWRRFIYLNLFAGFLITLLLIWQHLLR